MRYRKLDENGDYTFGRRDGFLFDVEAVAQAVKTRLLLLYGEWWEDATDGTPLFEEVLGRRFRTDGRPTEVDLVFSERVNSTMGVDGITSFDSGIDPETRGYHAAMVVKTVYGSEFKISLAAGGGAFGITMP